MKYFALVLLGVALVACGGSGSAGHDGGNGNDAPAGGTCNAFTAGTSDGGACAVAPYCMDPSTEHGVAPKYAFCVTDGSGAFSNCASDQICSPTPGTPESIYLSLVCVTSCANHADAGVSECLSNEVCALTAGTSPDTAVCVPRCGDGMPACPALWTCGPMGYCVPIPVCPH